MAYDDIFEPGIYKSWTEAIIKEKKIRTKWHADYESKQKQKALEKEAKDEIPEISCTCKGKAKESVLGAESKMDWPKECATGTSTLIRVVETPSSMIHPPPVVRSILYEGISRDGKGRAGYLKRRWQLDPEEKYRSRICTNWVYGWNHGRKNELCCKDYENCDIRKIAFRIND